jgi:hypothetical protein
MGLAIITIVEEGDLLGLRYVTSVSAGEHTIGLTLDGRPTRPKMPHRQNSECPAGDAIMRFPWYIDFDDWRCAALLLLLLSRGAGLLFALTSSRAFLRSSRWYSPLPSDG